MPATTILLVDAHDDSRVIYAAVLSHFGFRVLQSPCADEAMGLARAHPPQLVIASVPPAAAPAWALLHALRQHPATAAVPLLALSSTGQSEHHARARELGCAACLVKPLRPLELLAAARDLLGTH